MAVEVVSVVGGERVAEAVRRTPSTNPARLSEVVGTVGSAGPEVFVRAASVAQAAQVAWAATPAPQRGQVISNVGRLMTANKERLAALVTQEIGKPLTEEEVAGVDDLLDLTERLGERLADLLCDERREPLLVRGHQPADVRDRKSTRLNSSHPSKSRMPSSA